MALSSWKQFPFFNVSQVPVPADEEGSYIFEVCLTATGSDSLFLGSSNGSVRVLSRALKVVRTFQASDTSDASITHIKQIPETPFLVTISENLSSEPFLKVWALDKTEKKTGGPRCLCTIAVQNGRRQFPVSALVVLDDMSQVAVGFANGSVTVIRGDFVHDRGTKQRTVFESEDPITGLEIRQNATKVLYIANTAKICSLIISGKGQGQTARTVDNRGCNVGCMTQDRETGDIVIAREDAIHYYGPGGRGPSYAFEGPKKIVKMYKEYVGLVCPPRVAQVSKSKTFRRLAGDEIHELFSSSSFTLLDTDLKFIAHTESLPAQVKDVFVEWDELFLLTSEGKLFRYQEKTLQQKLEILYQRNLYIYAINLAQKAGADKVQQNIIFRKYGDYLYQKGDYDTAMQQYLRAIDNTEPSQVIRRFLDTQRIHNLIDYLEELHEHDKASPDHTTLLLNCYAKLKDTEKLDAFIRASGTARFDIETAIAMCRQGGYYDQAAYLATKHGENELVIDILIEDSKKYAEALQYIWRLNPDTAYPVLMKYARSLIEHCPEETTKLFIEYYTGRYAPKQDIPAVSEVQAQSGGGAFQTLSALWTLPFMSRASNVNGIPTGDEQKPLGEETQPTSVVVTPSYLVPRPRSAFSAFIARPVEFIQFLEALVRQESLAKEDRSDLSTTLFEMYLEAANSSRDPGERDNWQVKATSLIADNKTESLDESTIDTSNVLLLSSLSKFPTGTTLVRERENLYADIFRSFTSAKDTSGAISALRKYGEKDPSLYPLALGYFSSSEGILKEPGVKDELQNVLKKIDQEKLMAPLQVVKVLSQGGAVSMGMVKAYLSDNIQRERKEIQTNRRLIDSYRTETASKRSELTDLETKPVVFQARRCSSCARNLTLPTVHFMCKHSFHQECLNKPGLGLDEDEDDQIECPICKPGNDTIRAIRRQQVESTEQHDLFKAALARSNSRFETVSEFFGRGVMGTIPAAE
ncbi:Vacuolar protein sorting-associated protein 11 [Exophiala oligosperma]